MAMELYLFTIVFILKEKSVSLKVKVSFHERESNKFITPCLKMRSGLFSTLSDPHPALLRLLGYRLLRVNIRPDRTFKHDVTNIIIRPWAD